MDVSGIFFCFNATKFKSWKRLCFLTERNSWNSCNSFDFLTKRAWESVHHERLQNMTKHGVMKLSVATKREAEAERQNETHQRDVDELDQLPTGHKRVGQVSDGLNHVDQLQRKRSWYFYKTAVTSSCCPCGPNYESFFKRRFKKKKKSGFRIDPDLLAIKTKQLQSILTSVFLSVITADHLLLGGNSRSTVYQLTPPLNLSRKKCL